LRRILGSGSSGAVPQKGGETGLRIIMVPALILVVGASTASNFGLLDGRLAEVFPQDETKRAALSRCEIEAAAFNRFDAAARDACYRRTTESEFTGPSHTAAAPNQLDLRTAAARGNTGFMTR
jgi:hypothetical protein